MGSYTVSGGAYSVSGGAYGVGDAGSGGGGVGSTIDDFEDYADDGALESAWPTPGASFSATLHTSSPIEGAQSCETTATGVRMTSSSASTAEGVAYSVLMRFDGAVSGDPGFYTHAQDTADPFADQVWMRVETGGPTVGVYVREGGAYNDNSASSIGESLQTGTVYRLELLADASSSTATATLYNTDSDSQIGQASCAYNTSWSGGNLGLYGDADGGTQVYDIVEEV